MLLRHRERLKRTVTLRLDQRLQGRLDPSDVVQEACLEASQRIDEYLANREVPFFLWLRFLTCQKLVTLHRHHFGMKMRAVGREVALEAPASSVALAEHFIDRGPRPSEAAMRGEIQERCQLLLDGLEPLDREILALRHFEQLSNAEAARVLGLHESAASKRYIRAVRRLKEVMPS